MALYEIRRALARTVSRVPAGEPTPSILTPFPKTYLKHIPFTFKNTGVSADISLSLQLVQVIAEQAAIAEAHTFDSTELVAAISAVTPNLFDPLETPTAGGKIYGEREKYKARQPTFEGIAESTSRVSHPRKAYRIEKGERSTTVYRQSIWDLILPILQPPLAFDFPESLYLPADLFPHHIEGINFLRSHNSALLADEMGTGKTVASILALRVLFREGKIRTALVVCPVSVVGHSASLSAKPEGWDGHLSFWAPELDVTVVRGNTQTRQNDWSYPAHVYICTFDTLRNDVLDNEFLTTDDAVKFDAVIVDEAQNIKNPKSGRARAVRKLSPKYRWALTGTPLENKLEDLFAVFDFVKPGYLSENLKNLYAPGTAIQDLIRPLTLRRLKKDIMKDLPRKIRDEIWFDLDQDQTRAYEEAEAWEVKRLTDLGDRLTRVHIFAVIQRLKQICNFAPEQDTSAKASILEALVEGIVGEGKKVLVFSQYVDQGILKLEKLIQRLLPSPLSAVKVTGKGMTLRERQNAVEKFKTDPNTVVYLSTPRAGGVGLTLTEASYVIHFDHWWNPAIMWQAEDRAHRGGQTETVNVYSLWAEATASGKPTIEARIYNKLKEKGLLFENVLGGLSSKQFESLVSMDDWLEILGLKKPISWERREEEPKTVEMNIETVLARMDSMDPFEFEKLVSEIVRAIGFANPRTTKRSHDGGVDIVALRPGLERTESVVFQCKRMGMVGVEHARALLGVLAANQQLTKGYLVTSGTLSQECKAFCDRDGRLGYIDGPTTANYILKFKVPL